MKQTIGLKILGIAFILLGGIIPFILICPTKGQYFMLYIFVGVGLSLLFAKSAEKSNLIFKIKNIGIVLVGSVAIPVALIFINPIKSFKSDDCDLRLSSISLIVFVHGKKGKQDIILQKGSVILDVKGIRVESQINENGQAFFQNLHVGDQIRLDIKFSEHYRAIFPDSVYTIEADRPIYLEVALPGIDKVKGTVFYKDLPLDDVLIKLDTLIATTDKTGGFVIYIPEELQKNNGYSVFFMKEGFESKVVSAFPQTGEPLIIIMEKKLTNLY